MSRRGNPHDNPQAESFTKTLEVEAVHPDEYETCEDVTADPPRFIGGVRTARRPHSSPGCLQPGSIRDPQRPPAGQMRSLKLSSQGGALHWCFSIALNL